MTRPQCKGFCEDYPHVRQPRYGKGHKKCTCCEIWFTTLPENVFRCPCCHCRLGTKPKSGKLKQKLREAHTIEV